MNKFKKKELMNRLGMDEEKAKLVIDIQKQFPELLLNDGEGFCVNGRTMWEQLNKPQGQFNKWIERKVLNKNYKENIDFSKVDNFVHVGNLKRHQADYMFTVNCAKKIGMRENTIEGDLICDYFIYLEEAIKDMTKWYEARNPQIKSYKEMCNIIDKQYIKNHDGKKASPFVYSNNADMLNLAMVQLKSKQIKEVINIGRHDSLRDNLVYEFNKALDELQVLNGNLVLSNIDFATRKMIIENTCREKYSSIRVRFVSEFHKEIDIVKKTIK